MHRQCFILWSLLAAVVTTRAADPVTNRFDGEIAAFLRSDRTNPPASGGILFIGSSSIRLWKTLTNDFPQHRVFNRGFGGSEISDSLHFLDRIVLPYAPRQIVLYAGGNDLNGGKSPATVLADFQSFVTRVHEKLPATRISYISIAGNPARWSQVERVKQANELIAAHTRTDPRLEFIDIFPALLGTDGLPRTELFVADRLHMSPAGYAIWRGIVGPKLTPEFAVKP